MAIVVYITAMNRYSDVYENLNSKNILAVGGRGYRVEFPALTQQNGINVKFTNISTTLKKCMLLITPSF